MVVYGRAAQYQYFPINSISIIQSVFLSIPISISIIFKRAYQYQYFINYSKNSLINFNINTSYQYILMILLRLPISYQLVIVINIDINYQNRLLSISMRYQLWEHSLINFNINIAIFPYQWIELLCFRPTTTLNEGPSCSRSTLSGGLLGNPPEQERSQGQVEESLG